MYAVPKIQVANTCATTTPRPKSTMRRMNACDDGVTKRLKSLLIEHMKAGFEFDKERTISNSGTRFV